MIFDFFKKLKGTPMEDITVQELKAKMDRGDDFVLIDVREPEEFKEYNMGGKLIPLGSVPSQIQTGAFEDMAEKEIILHCRSGKRSKTAQAFLRDAGITNTKNLTGGAMAWAKTYG